MPKIIYKSLSKNIIIPLLTSLKLLPSKFN